jgi:hypothetical protein
MAEISIRQMAQTLATIDARTAQMAQTLATVDARTAQMNRKLDDLTNNLRGLSLSTARMPDGRTLINVVGTILNEVQDD